MSKIAVVGAGVGGLATAARLAHKGHQVTVFEKLPRCGGRNNIIADRGFKFDTGPSFVLMPDFFEEVFASCGQDLRSRLTLRVLETSYKIFYPDQTSVVIYRDSQKTKAELERIEPGASRAYDAFIEETRRIYAKVRPLLYSCFTKKDALRPAYWPLIRDIRTLESYWHLASRFFKSEKLRYAFTFEAMFIGVSPFSAPAFYSVITYADHVQKIYHPMGGMYMIPQALQQLAQENGTEFLFSEPVTKIGKADGGIELKTARGSQLLDRVVVNADFSGAQTDLLGRRIPRYDYSCSVFLLYLGLRSKVRGLAHHNLFFSRDLVKNLRQIFGGAAIPEDPSFYIHVPTVTDLSLAPAGKDIVYVLVPVPNLSRPYTDGPGWEEAIRALVFNTVRRQCGFNLEPEIEVEHRFYPEDFISRYSVKNAATFGLAHTLLQSAFFRPPNQDLRMRGLYYVGASTQPGGGLPVVIAGSRVVSDLITER